MYLTIFLNPGFSIPTPNDEAKYIEIVERALEDGYRHLDTAYAYNSETFIGKALQKWMSSGKVKREDLFIFTNVN